MTRETDGLEKLRKLKVYSMKSKRERYEIKCLAIDRKQKSTIINVYTGHLETQRKEH